MKTDPYEPSTSLVILRCGMSTRRKGDNWNTEGEWLSIKLCVPAPLPGKTKARQRGAETKSHTDVAVHQQLIGSDWTSPHTIRHPGVVSPSDDPLPTVGLPQGLIANGRKKGSSLLYSLHIMPERHSQHDENKLNKGRGNLPEVYVALPD